MRAPSPMKRNLTHLCPSTSFLFEKYPLLTNDWTFVVHRVWIDLCFNGRIYLYVWIFDVSCFSFLKFLIYFLRFLEHFNGRNEFGIWYGWLYAYFLHIFCDSFRDLLGSYILPSQLWLLASSISATTIRTSVVSNRNFGLQLPWAVIAMS